MGSDVAKIKGFVRRGGEVSYYDPHQILIVGLDVAPGEEDWPFVCPRLDKEVREVEAEVKGTWRPEFGDVSLDGIRQEGVLRPVEAARRNSEGKHGANVVQDQLVRVAGTRRLLRARIVWDEEAKARVPVERRKGAVPVLIRKGAPEVLYGLNMNENFRKGITRLERAAQVVHWLQHVPTQLVDDAARYRAAATAFRCTDKTIKNLIAIPQCTKAVQQLIDEGVEDAKGKIVRLAYERAFTLAQLPAAEQDRIAAELRATGAQGETAKRVIRAVKDANGQRPSISLRLYSSPKVADVYDKLGTVKDTPETRIAQAVVARLFRDDKALDTYPVLKECFDAVLHDGRGWKKGKPRTKPGPDGEAAAKGGGRSRGGRRKKPKDGRGAEE